MSRSSEGQWFSMFRRDRHVSEAAEFNPLFPVHLSVDCGVSRWTGGLLYQFVPIDCDTVRMHVFADYLSVDRLSEENAQSLMALVQERTNGQGILDAVLIDPASGARTGVGPAAESEYQTRVRTSRETLAVTGGARFSQSVRDLAWTRDKAA